MKYIGINLTRKIWTLKTIRHWEKKVIQINEKITHGLVLEELIALQFPCYPMQYTDSMHFLSKLQFFTEIEDKS